MTDINVKTLQGKLWSVKVEQADTIAVVKKKLEDKEAGPVEAQRLIFGGKILEDAKTVGEYELTKGDNPAPLFLVINPEIAKKAEEAKKARDAAAAAEAAKKAAEAKANDPAVIGAQIAAVAKKLAATKSIHELLGAMEAELKALKKPAAGAGGAGGVGGAGAAAKPATEWACASCTTVNKPAARRCEVCDTPNPNAPKAAAGGSNNDPWVCASCTFNNKGGTRRCGMCDSANPAFPQAAPAVVRLQSQGGDEDPQGGFAQGGDF